MNRFLFLFVAAAFVATSCTPDAGLLPKADGSIFDGDLIAAQDLAEALAIDWADGPAGVAALDGVDAVEVQQIQIDWLGMAHVRLDQVEDGVPVFGGQLILHLLPSGAVDTVTDALVRDLDADTAPLITSDQAEDAALATHYGVTDRIVTDLQVLRHDGLDSLTYRVAIDSLDTDYPSRPVMFVDAQTGDLIWRYDNLQTARNRLTYDGRNRNRLPGRLERSEGQGPTGDGPIDDAHDHAGITYDYYFAIEGRDSFDDAGATMISTAHHGRNVDNAYWDGTQMIYGDGDVYFLPLSGSLDVVGHELTHAVTEYTSNLIYSGESGGLNEASSDILGVAVDSWSRGWAVDANTWLVGEDIALPPLGAALRYMDNPPADGVSIDHYGDYTSGMDVHYSSGIANKAFYLTVMDPGASIEDAATVWYRALTLYMTPSTDFAAGRAAAESAATDLFGTGSPQLAAV